MTLAIFAAVYVGFARTFFLRPWFPEFAAQMSPPEPFFYFHAVIFTAWFVVLLVQPEAAADDDDRGDWEYEAQKDRMALLGDIAHDKSREG